MVCLCSWGKNVKKCLNNPSCLTLCIGVAMRFNVAQRDRAPWLHMLLACVVCVCVLHVSPWFAQPGRSLGLLLGETEQREHRKKKNRTPRDAKQEHFWTLTHFTYFYIPSHQLHINFVRRMAPGGTHPESKSSNSDPGSRLWNSRQTSGNN